MKHPGWFKLISALTRYHESLAYCEFQWRKTIFRLNKKLRNKKGENCNEYITSMDDILSTFVSLADVFLFKLV